MHKKIFSFLLAIILLVTSVNLPNIQLNAEESDGESGNAEPQTGSTVVTIYGNNGNGEVDLSISNHAEFDYGTMITLSLSGVSYPTTFRIIKAGETDDKIYRSDVIYDPGEYHLGYICDTGYDPEVEDTSFENYAFTIVATKLGVPSNLRWEGTKAVWNTLKTDGNGNTITGTCDYIVTLYRDGEKVKETARVAGVNAESQSYDFASDILSSSGGQGKYTFSVQAVVPASLSTYYTNSDHSGQSASALHAVKVTLEAQTGIASATVASSEDTSFLLIAGAEGYDSKTVLASASEGWSFGTWSIEGISDSDSSIFFDSAQNANATLTITSGYSGASEVTIMAAPHESTPPVISSYTIGTGANEGKLVATVRDTQSGMKAYAFSTKDAAGLGESDWTVLENVTTDVQTFCFAPETAGNYYFYAKDADGNISRSESSVPVMVITYQGYYENNVRTSKTAVYIGTAGYTLPDLQDTSETVYRKGYKFEGWYTSTDYLTKVTALSGNDAAGVTYYAKWTETELAWEQSLEQWLEQSFEGKNIPYSGTDIALTAKVNTTTADVRYIWYQKKDGAFQQIASNTTGTYSIRNVGESGEYRVDAVVTYTNDEGEEQTKTLNGDPVTITITPASLTVTADEIHIAYGDEVPVYTVSYTGLLGEDVSDESKARITKGSLSCPYVQGNPCRDGGYAITFATDFSSENYTITQQAGTLFVDPKDVKAEDTSVTVMLDSTVTYTYTGEPVTPVITVTDDGETVPSSEYSISYDDNVSAGNHTATITFRGNYTGVVYRAFTIVKSGDYSPVVTIDDWDYGDEAKRPSLSDTVPYENPDITYYYLDGEQTGITEGMGSKEQPVNAGTYTVYAVVKDPAGNYADKMSAPVFFTIHKKTVYLIAGSQEWEYDGNPHSCDSYIIQDKNGNEITQDQVFELNTESFQSIKVTGSVTDVTLDENGHNIGVKNVVSYSLTSVTNRNNYDIQCVDGVLKVTPTQLLSPANLQWDSANPGTATWVAISRADLVVQYEVRLYMHDAITGVDQEITSAKKTTSDTSVNFAEDIHRQISTDSQKSFYFTVKTLVSGSTDEGQKVQHDYTASEESDPSSSIYTATVYLTKKLCDDETSDQEGLASIAFTGKYAGYQAVTLIAGESVTAQATVNTGYMFSYYATCSHDSSHKYYNTIWHPTNPELLPYFTCSYSGSGAVTITVSPDLTQSLTGVQMTASVEDSAPYYRNFTVANKADYSGVTFSIELMDEIGIRRWRLQKVKEEVIQHEDGSTSTIYRILETYDWNSLETESGYPAGGEYVPVSDEIAKPGTYRIQCSDSILDDSRAYSVGETFTVYEICFEKGETDDTVHTMAPVYKLANTEITLPACTFTKTGYSFQNWSGAATGISVDGAVFKANASDTLVACWTGNQYTYRVEYYYMNTDGTYSSDPTETAEFTGKYGDQIVASTDGTDTATESIQKPKRNYSNDPNPVNVEDYQNKITLTGNGQTLRIYYKSGNYTITYKYTVPGASAPTEIVIPYNYGSAITEPGKPTKSGYDFVGWVYEGYGSAPETMPAKNLIATGNFVAKSASYQVVYHLETLGNGTNHTGEYAIDPSLTQSYNSKQGELIKAYPAKGAELGTNEIEGSDIAGFTLEGVVVSYGSAADSKDGIVTAEGAYVEGTVQYASNQTLYINYYYTRNEYTLTLEVWKDNRETAGNRIYSKGSTYQYGEDVSGPAEQYQLDSYYINEAGESVLEDFPMPEGYKFASYTDFSTGKAPSVMPAGNVTVTRDVVAADRVEYYIDVYFEKSAIGTFDRVARLTYEAVAGTQIKIVGDGDPQEDSGYTYVNYNDFVETLTNYNYYTHIVIDGSSKEEGPVSADQENPLVLKVYFERITTTATISYIYGNSSTGGTRTLTSFQVSGKWGSSYTFDPIALFDENTPDNWISEYSDPEKLNNTVTQSPTTVANVVIPGSGETVNGLTYDFRTGNYLVSYQCHYDYLNSNNTRSDTWPSYTFTTVSNNPSTHEIGYKQSSTMSAGLGDTIQCYFGVTNAYCKIAYNQIELDEDFYLDVRLDYRTRFIDSGLGWYQGTEANGNSTATSNYGGTTDYIPITYPYDRDGNGSIGSDEYYQLRIMNKCAIEKGTPVEAGGSLAEYPAANAKNRSYSYAENPETATLMPGFTWIEGNYYFYDGSVGNAEGAYGSTPCVYLADTKDGFMQGAYYGYTLNTGKGYAQVTAFLDAYKTAHGESLAVGAVEDDNAQALHIYNTSYGSKYIYGSHDYLTYTFYYYDRCQLSFWYNGTGCSREDHLYVYGTRLSKEEITCDHFSGIPDGYELVWYMDGNFATPIPESGLVMDVSRSVYGRIEKKMVPNMEYIYYELADPITVTDPITKETVTYNYVTQDNITAIRDAGYEITESTETDNISIDSGHGTTVTKQYHITTYTYEGAVVMVAIERPTVTYTELYLAKDTDAYSSYSGDYEEAYGKPGFYYDETNTDNRSYGYVNTTPIILKVYFARDKYQVKVLTNISDQSNPESYMMSVDQKVQLEEPVRDGYTFAGWTWEKVTASGTEPYNPSLEEGEAYFKMPAFPLQATAQWTPAEFSQTVTHYFQTAEQTYESAFITGITGTPDKTFATVSFNGVTGSADVYMAGDTVTAVVLTTEAELTTEAKYYFSGGKLESDSIRLEEADLVAAVTKITVKSEEETGADQGAITGLSMYSYAYTSYQSGTTIRSLGADGKYTTVYGMTLEYYYTRSASCTVRLFGVATDGRESGLSFNGAGDHIFGESVNLIAVLAEGYEFLGWYNAIDVFSDYPEENAADKALSEYTVKSDLADVLSEITPVSVSTTYNLSVTTDLDLIAVVKPENVIAPDLVINGKTSYTYGYEESASNALMAIASKSAEAAKTTITGYQWYRIEAEFDAEGNVVAAEDAQPQLMDGQTSSTLLIPTGLNAGAYLYRCVVSYKNNDNGREDTIFKDQGIVVKKANMSVSTVNYVGVFDNQEHSIMLSVSKPFSPDSYTIYYNYNAESELNETNYATAGTIAELPPSYVHVNSDENGACAHTTYFYIKDNTGNYNDYIGSATVDIKPRTISIRTLNATFSKMYDGNVEVEGTSTDGQSDMYHFAHGKGTYYELSGFLEEDTAASSYILACSAAFNDYHVATAKSFTIRDLRLVYDTDDNKKGETAYDYAFPSTTSLTFAGMITPRRLNVEWDEQSQFVYNGTLQAPQVHLSETQTNPIPLADQGKIVLTVTGGQINVGSYTAYASAGVGEGARFFSSDYTFDTLSKEYDIVAREITVEPVNETITYDGSAHTLSSYRILYNGSEDTVVNSYTTTATQGLHYTNAGTYSGIQFSNLVILDASGKILTDNYIINYGSGTLTIDRAPVTVTGITAESKDYDGTDSAVIHVENAIFSPLYTQGTLEDALALDSSQIQAAYASAAAGETVVNLMISENALTGRSAANYKLIPGESQKTAVGLIGQSQIRLKANAVETVYGENADFTYSYSGIIRPDGTEGTWADITVEGSVTYEINTGTKETPVWEAYVPGTTPAGTYEIRINVDSISTHDYEFVWEEDENAVLTVKKRPVSLNAVTGTEATIKKTYDGTTTVTVTPEKGTHYTFGKVTENEVEITASGVLDDDVDGFDLSRLSCVYDTKDITASKVVLTNAEIANGNYELVNTSCDIPGQIEPANLTIRAKAKSITYGTTAPVYEAEYEGFVTVNGVPETAVTALSGNLSFRNATYNAAVPENRHVGTYTNDIIPGGYGDEGDVNGNYKIHYEPATLTVTPATVTLTADDKTLRYYVGNDEDHDGNAGELPAYTYQSLGWAYEGDAARYDLSGVTLYRTKDGTKSDNADDQITLLTVPGDYPIKISVGEVTYDDGATVIIPKSVSEDNPVDSYDDYIFTVASGTLKVEKYTLTITGTLDLGSKYYDGTTAITSEQEPTEAQIAALIYTGIAAEDQAQAGIDTEKLLSGSQYESANAGESITVNLSIDLNAYLSQRYILESANVTATASIRPRPIQIQAKNHTITYGDPVPGNDDYEIIAVPVSDPMSDDNMGLVSGETLTTAGFLSPTSYTCAYQASLGHYSPADDYPVTPVGVTAGNYDVECVDNGVLIVRPATLATPAPVWDGGHPGTVTWTAVSGIGDVAVAGYRVVLYKDGVAVLTKNLSATDETYDFASDIRTNGGGQYTVKVTAVASTVNNIGNCNVKDSTAGATAKALYATKITPVFAGEASGKGAQVDSHDPIYIHEENSYVVIAGESNIAVSGVLKNATGYTVAATAASGLTLGEGSIVENASGDPEQTVVSYQTIVSVASDAQPEPNTTITLTLTARRATLNAQFTVTTQEVTYGFGEAERPLFTTVAEPGESDNIGAEGYTYTYEWKFMPSSSDVYDSVQNSAENTYRFPCSYGSYANTPYGTDYRIKCSVTATRMDNGESTTVEAISSLDRKYYIRISVKRGRYNPAIAFNPGEDTWVYGESRNIPYVSGTVGEVTQENIHLLYSEDGVTWRDRMYTDVGTYYVKAHIDETTNYDAVDTNVIQYEITQATLAQPESVHMTGSATAPYGRIEWNGVSGPKENAGASSASDSSVAVKYKLTLAYIPSGGNTRQQIGEPVITSDTYYDFTDRITEEGTYYVTVQAIVDEQRDGQDALNCADSALAEIQAFITIGAKINSNLEDNSYGKVYDGTPLTLTVVYSDGSTPTYQWMKNGEAIAGANSDSLSITYVEESASYVCQVTTGSEQVIYSRAIPASITKRPITLTTATDTKTYDGSALTNPNYSITSELGLVSGDTITAYSMTASQTHYGSSENTISGIEITRRVDGNKIVYSENDPDVSDNYEITVVKGTLSIVPKPVTLTWSEPSDMMYNGQEKTVTATITNQCGSDVVVVSSYANNVNTAADTYTATALMLSGEDASDYTLTGATNVSYSYTITKRPLEITAGSAAKIYDGNELTDGGYEITGTTQVAEGERLVSVQINGTRTVYGTSANVPSNAVIKRGDVDVSGNYTVSYVDGTLTVNKRQITITAENKESCYGETPAVLTCSITNPAEAGTMTDAAIKTELGVTLICAITDTTPVGNAYPITVSYDATNLNYDVTTVDGTYQVKPAEITLIGENNGIEYDCQPHSLIFTVSLPVSDGVTRYYSTFDLSDAEWQTEIAKLAAGNTSDKVSTGLPSYTEVGIYTVYCYGTKENYTPGKASATLTITRKPIDSGDITVDTLPDEVYSGSAYTPALTVRYGDTVLVQDRDYTVGYADNTDAGDATVTITGIGNYTDDRATGFTINPKPITLTWSEPSDMMYNGQEKTVTATITNRCGSDDVVVSSYANNVNTAADTYTATALVLGGADASNYTLTGATNVSHSYTITKRPLEILILGDSKVYDGTPLTRHEYSLENGTSVAYGETLHITYTGTQTEADSSDNTVSDITVLRGAEDVTENYTITPTSGRLTVEPRQLQNGDLVLTQTVLEYTGSGVSPEYTVRKELIVGNPAVTLAEGTDFTITPDSEKTALQVGIHTITAEGTGNYYGRISVSYSIVDNEKAAITGITNNGEYCISIDMEITDPNLVEVLIQKDGTQIVASFDSFTDGSLEYTLDGRNADVNGSEYTVYVKDLASKDAGGTEHYHEQTYTITLYPDHRYDADQNQYTWDSSRLAGTQDCNNTGDVEDTIINRWGTVVWNYHYSYSTPTGEQSGTQGVEARATYAKVELLQDGQVIATQYVNCDSTCGVGSPAADSGSASYLFKTYDPADPTASCGTSNIPQKDENGRDYTYSLNFTVGRMTDGVFTAANDYAYSDSMDYSAPYTSCGYQRTYSYNPECFNVPWQVTLTNLPRDEEGNMIYPSTLYVKVLYAMSADADDSETVTGYQIISQQAGASDLGVPCTASVNGNTVVYTGSYPVWKYIGGTTDSYYHRIQVVGYELNNQYVEVSSYKLKSINDADHVNHTICYSSDTGRASGTIRYELSALLPSLIFDRNDGSRTAHAVINSVMNGTVSYDDIQAVLNPTRSGYTFLGWYTEPVNGTKITEDVAVGTLGVTVYAHWERNAVPPQGPGTGDNPGSGGGTGTGSGTETDSGTENQSGEGNADLPETSTENPPSLPDPSPAIPGNPSDSTPDETVPSSSSGEQSAESGSSEKDSSLSVYTVYGDEEDNSATSEEAGQSTESQGADQLSHPTASLPDPAAVADAVLTEEEWKILDEGGNIQIRLTIDDTKAQEENEEFKRAMAELLTSELLSEADRSSGKTVQFRSYIDLRLEKKINEADWERIYNTDEPIEIVINIPEDMRNEGETICLVKADGSGYIILEDLDDDPNTITIMTADFDAEYMLVSIMDEETPLGMWNGSDEAEDNIACRWHYIIWIVTLAYFLILLLTLKRKQEEEENETEKTDDKTETEDAWKKRKRHALTCRSISQIALLICYIWVNIRGFCRIELPASIIGILLIGIEQILTYRHKFKQDIDKDSEQE